MAEAEGGAVSLGEDETLRWLIRIDQALDNLRNEIGADRRNRDERYVTTDRYEIEIAEMKKDIADVKDSNKYAVRTAAGAVVGVIVALVVAWAKLKGG